MTLDLDELTTGWECPPGEMRARVVRGRDGDDVVQLRIDLGVMQMLTAGRPDGERWRGMPTAREYITHELHIGRDDVLAEDWEALERELVQINYRRIAFAMAAEDAMADGRGDDARRFLRFAVRDVDEALAILALQQRHGRATGTHAALQPTLTFDRARLAAQARIVEGRFEEAIEDAEAGAGALAALLAELGYDEAQIDQDQGLAYLQNLALQLRREYGIAQTLRERLEEAINDEDFEAAAELHDQLRRRAADDAGG